ncbi:MAG TPA: hypothetical protein VF133_13360 [Terriglobales bacterium]
MQLCQEAGGEQDPDKLLQLVQEINQLLAKKEQRLADKQAPVLPDVDAERKSG